MSNILKFVVLAAFGFIFIKMVLPTTLDTMIENARVQTSPGSR